MFFPYLAQMIFLPIYNFINKEKWNLLSYLHIQTIPKMNLSFNIELWCLFGSPTILKSNNFNGWSSKYLHNLNLFVSRCTFYYTCVIFYLHDYDVKSYIWGMLSYYCWIICCAIVDIVKFHTIFKIFSIIS